MKDIIFDTLIRYHSFITIKHLLNEMVFDNIDNSSNGMLISRY